MCRIYKGYVNCLSAHDGRLSREGEVYRLKRNSYIFTDQVNRLKMTKKICTYIISVA